MEHKASEGDVMEAGRSLGLVLIVARQTTESSGPGKASFNHPAARQYETALGLGVLDHFQRDTVCLSRLACIFFSVALIHISHCHALVDQVLQCLRQFFHLHPVIFMTGLKCRASRCPNGIDGRTPLGFVISSTGARLRGGLQCATAQDHSIAFANTLPPTRKSCGIMRHRG